MCGSDPYRMLAQRHTLSVKCCTQFTKSKNTRTYFFWWNVMSCVACIYFFFYFIFKHQLLIYNTNGLMHEQLLVQFKKKKKQKYNLICYSQTSLYIVIFHYVSLDILYFPFYQSFALPISLIFFFSFHSFRFCVTIQIWFSSLRKKSLSSYFKNFFTSYNVQYLSTESL